MKTIKAGIKVPQLWEGKLVKCEHCGFEGQLEKGDDEREWWLPWQHTATAVAIACPCCRNTMEVSCL